MVEFIEKPLHSGEKLWMKCDDQEVEVFATDVNFYDSDMDMVLGGYVAILFYTGTVCCFHLYDIDKQFTRKKPD